MPKLRATLTNPSNGTRAKRGVAQLGRYVVCDPAVCHGKPTMRGTRVLVADVLAQVEAGLSPDEICRQWYGWLAPEAVAEAVGLARTYFLDAANSRRFPRRKAA